MRLTVYTDYSLRVLMFLALKENGLATIAEIAASYRISRNHLMKVAHQLGIAGYVNTVRGKGGGLRLARPPQLIVLGEVVRHTEPDMALLPCFDSPAECRISRCCGLYDVLAEANSAFLAVLDRYTLADLVRLRMPLQKLLHLNQDTPKRRRRQAVGPRRVGP